MNLTDDAQPAYVVVSRATGNDCYALAEGEAASKLETFWRANGAALERVVAAHTDLDRPAGVPSPYQQLKRSVELAKDLNQGKGWSDFNADLAKTHRVYEQAARYKQGRASTDLSMDPDMVALRDVGAHAVSLVQNESRFQSNPADRNALLDASQMFGGTGVPRAIDDAFNAVEAKTGVSK